MGSDSEVILTVHGLDVDNGKVRAEVFLEKFRALIVSLKIADKSQNEKKAHEYIIVGLKVASAQAAVREKVMRKLMPISSVGYVSDAVSAVYNGDRNIARYPAELIAAMQPLVRGIGKKFNHGELDFGNGNVIRIDDYLEKQLEKAVRRMSGEQPEEYRNFEGIAFETFDGIVKELDARGNLIRGKLILTVGGKELDCVFRTGDIQLLRDSFDKRARVEGVAHYDGVSLLPARIDVRTIELVKIDGNLLRWKGALRRGRGGGLIDE